MSDRSHDMLKAIMVVLCLPIVTVAIGFLVSYLSGSNLTTVITIIFIGIIVAGCYHSSFAVRTAYKSGALGKTLLKKLIYVSLTFLLWYLSYDVLDYLARRQLRSAIVDLKKSRTHIEIQTSSDTAITLSALDEYGSRIEHWQEVVKSLPAGREKTEMENEIDSAAIEYVNTWIEIEGKTISKLQYSINRWPRLVSMYNGVPISDSRQPDDILNGEFSLQQNIGHFPPSASRAARIMTYIYRRLIERLNISPSASCYYKTSLQLDRVAPEVRQAMLEKVYREGVVTDAVYNERKLSEIS